MKPPIRRAVETPARHTIRQEQIQLIIVRNPIFGYGAKPTAVSTMPSSRLSGGAKNVWSIAISTMAAAPAARTGGDSKVYVPGAW